jgi:hypothetical protein
MGRGASPELMPTAPTIRQTTRVNKPGLDYAAGPGFSSQPVYNYLPLKGQERLKSQLKYRNIYIHYNGKY